LKQIRRHLTYANVMSSIAVFLMLGGATAFAATKVGSNEIKANSIKTGKIVKEAVTAGKLKKGAVTESRIANDAVTGAKVKDGSLTGSDINASTLGQVPNAKTLDGIGASAFSRQASSGINNNALAGAVVGITAREVNINAPQNGFLLMIASSDVFGSTADVLDCELNVDGTELRNTQRTIDMGPENDEENCGTNGVVAVNAGSHNVKFNYIGRATSTTVDETELNVVFIPFAG
jgi:hypothetical protein